MTSLLESWKGWVQGKRVFYVVLISVLFINVVVYSALGQTGKGKKKEITEDLEKSRGSLQKSQADLAAKKARIAEIERMERKIDFVYHNVLMTREERFSQIRKELEKFFTDFHVENTSKNYGWNTIPQEEVTQCNITCLLKGSYESLRRFLESMERSDYLLIIDEINLAESVESGRELNLSIRISTYFFEPQLPEQGKGKKL